MAVLLIMNISARAVAVFESLGDTARERRRALERLLDDAHIKRLREVDEKYRRIARSGGGAR